MKKYVAYLLVPKENFSSFIFLVLGRRGVTDTCTGKLKNGRNKQT